MNKRAIIVGILSLAGLFAQPKPPAPPEPSPSPSATPTPKRERIDPNAPEEALYQQAARLLQRRDWENAMRAYNLIMQKQGAKYDGAAYWNAYSMYKLGQSEQALRALTDLYNRMPSSRWLNDAKALEIEIRRYAGQPVSPEEQSDEDLKLMAVASLMSSDPARAVPILEKVVFGGGSVRLKEQALFVLAQKRSPESRAILARVAKGESNPDLQLRAFELLGIQGGPENVELLGSMYSSVQDKSMRRRILQGLGMARAGDRLLEIFKTEQDPSLRREALHMLAFQTRALTSEAARSMYNSETDRSIRRELLNFMAMRRDGAALTEIARNEKDLSLRREAIERLRMVDQKAADDILVEILQK